MSFKTEYAFELPRGFVDETGTLHKKGVMRLATAADEILPMRDQRVQQNPGYLSIILLTRVITKLGSVKGIDTKVIEQLFTADLSFLQSFYQQINDAQMPSIKTVCPKCDHEFDVEMSFLEEGETT